MCQRLFFSIFRNSAAVSNVARRTDTHDARGANLLERQQPAPVAGDEVIGLGRLEELLDPAVAACPAEFDELPR